MAANGGHAAVKSIKEFRGDNLIKKIGESHLEILENYCKPALRAIGMPDADIKHKGHLATPPSLPE